MVVGGLSPAINRPFPSSAAHLYQNEVKCSTFDMEMIFHSHANKTHLTEGFWTAKQSVFFSKSVKKSVKRGVRLLRARSV